MRVEELESCNEVAAYKLELRQASAGWESQGGSCRVEVETWALQCNMGIEK